MDASEGSFYVPLSISDTDGYGIIFYSNYLKYNIRAAFNLLMSGALKEKCRVSLLGVESMKYLKQGNWGDKIQ